MEHGGDARATDADRARSGGQPGHVGDVLDLGLLDPPGTVDTPGVETLDADPRRTSPVSRRRLLAGAVGLAASGALAIVATRVASSRGHPSTAVPVAGRARSSAAGTGRAAGPVTVVETGHPLLDARSEWDVFALGHGRLVRVHPASGHVTVTALPTLGDASASLVPARRRVLVHPADYREGYVVPDDRPAADLPLTLNGSGPLLPGPDQGHVWVAADNMPFPTLALLTVDGAWSGVTAPPPPYPIGGPFADGAGYVLYACAGGVYRAGQGPPRRISQGALLAVGAPGWVTVECDDVAACAVVLRRRAGGSSVVPVRIGLLERRGVLAPDGRRMALSVPGTVGSPGLVLVDLTSGAQLDVPLPLADTDAEAALAWSPDGRRLLAADASGQIQVVDPGTGETEPLVPGLPAVVQLAVRGA
ncbi:MAG TPA: hypothetical protein VMT69_03235 [Kineosporiaceae bacterium]|nr:hypothetical protein [Kineosporiaceae bacterium]